jgi:O-antigen ligase
MRRARGTQSSSRAIACQAAASAVLGTRFAVVSRGDSHTVPMLKLALTLLFIVAIWLVQCLVGGTRLVYSVPSYAILAIAGIATVFAIRRPFPKANAACLLTSGIFFAYILARAALSPIGYLWWMDFYMVLACLVVYLLTAFYISSSALRILVVAALLVLALAEILVGLRQFTVGDNWMPFGFVRSNYGSRASGMFISSIHLAGYLEAVGIMALSVAIWSSLEIWKRIAFGYMAVLCYVGVGITGSRGGYLSSVFSLFVFAALTLLTRWRINPQRLARSLVITLAALVAFISVALVVMQKSELLRRRLQLIGQPDVRLYNWQAAIDQFKVAPAFGTGAGTHLYYGRFFRRPQIQADPEHAHNDYLELLAEYGLVGLVGMTIFLFVHVNSCTSALALAARSRAEDSPHDLRDNRIALQIGSLSAISAYLAHSVTDFNLHVPGNALLFAFIFGITANPAGSTFPEKASALGGRLAQAGLPVISLFLLIAGSMKFPGDYWCERARIALHFRQYDAALSFAEKALSWERSNPDIYFLMAGAYAGVANGVADPISRRLFLDRSIKACQASLLIFPQNEHALMRLARLLDETKRFREAGEAYRQAITLDPNLGSIRAYYSRHLALVGRIADAQEQAQKARELGTSVDPDKLLQ